jgi:hypothetical protein
MSTAQEVEKFKAFLKQADSQGISLYDHLTNVILHLGQEQPANALAAFEAISKSIKNNTLTPTVLKEISTFSSEGERGRVTATVERIAQLIQTEPVPRPEPQTLEEKKKLAANVEPDVMGDAALLEWGGVSLGDETNYKLTCSINALVAAQVKIMLHTQDTYECRFVPGCKGHANCQRSLFWKDFWSAGRLLHCRSQI